MGLISPLYNRCFKKLQKLTKMIIKLTKKAEAGVSKKIKN